jgi:DNA-directed RNA polymerase subunit RPC12/RpoP
MSVTDEQSVAGETLASRNAELVELERRISGAMPRRSHVDVERRKRIDQSNGDASICVVCGEPIAPGTPVWRRSIAVRCLFGWGSGIGASCGAHGEGWDPFRAESFRWAEYVCAGCGRVVHDTKRRRVVTCSKACARLVVARRRADIREGRRFACSSCGEEYQPARADSRFCSNACRQSAYRFRRAVTS